MRKFLDKILFFTSILALSSVMVYLINELILNYSEERMLEEKQKEFRYYSPDTPAYYLRLKESGRVVKSH